MTFDDRQTYIQSACTLFHRIRGESLADLWMGVVGLGRAMSQAIFSLAAKDAVNERRTTPV